MWGLLADCKHALRLYRRTPISSLIAVVVLAVGMAFVGSFLSLYVDLAFKPFPGIENSRRLVTIAQVNDTQSNSIPFRFTERISEEVTTLAGVVGINLTNLTTAGDAERVTMEYASRGFFNVVRPKLALGRGFEPVEHDFEAEPVVVISDRYWREQLGGTPNVLGAIIEFDPPPGAEEQEPSEFRIIGVMAPEMRGVLADDVDLWAPFERTRAFTGVGSDSERAQAYMYSIGRLRPGASAEAVLREIQGRFPDADEDFELGAGFRIDAADGVVRDVRAHRAAESQLRVFLAGSVLLALVAAANVSLFLLARAPGRRRELGIRQSVGAPLKRLARQLVSESSMLVAVSGMLGLLVSVWLAKFLPGMAFLRQAEWGNVTLLDWRVLSLVGAFLLILTLLVSLAPILGLKRLGIASAGRQVAARATLAQRIAGTVQIAIAGAVGGAAIAFIWFLGSMLLGHPGYETEERYVVSFYSHSLVPGSETTAVIEVARHRELIESMPGVRAITFSFLVPGQNLQNQRQVRNPIDPSQEITTGYARIDNRFVDVLGLRLLYGRAPTENEIGASLVNESLARLLFNRENVVGENLDIAAVGGMNFDVARSTEIVGVLEDLSFLHPAAEIRPMLFTSLPPPPLNVYGSIIESPLPGAELQQQLQDLIDSGALEFAGVGSFVPLRDFRDRRLAPDKARGLLTIGTAGLVVSLAAFGFYGTQRYLVAAGRREYAIRASIGAGPKSLGRLVFGRGLMLSIPGLATGALLAFIAVAWLRDDFLSREISPGIVTVAAVIGLTLLLLAASLGPARQARRTQLAPLLRED